MCCMFKYFCLFQFDCNVAFCFFRLRASLPGIWPWIPAKSCDFFASEFRGSLRDLANENIQTWHLQTSSDCHRYSGTFLRVYWFDPLRCRRQNPGTWMNSMNCLTHLSNLQLRLVPQEWAKWVSRLDSENSTTSTSAGEEQHLKTFDDNPFMKNLQQKSEAFWSFGWSWLI